MSNLVFHRLLIVSAWLTATSAIAISENQPGLESAEFIYETAPFPSCHASTLAESKDGLLAAWFGGTHERHPDVGIWVSHCKDGKWSPPVEVANGVESETVRYPTWNPVLFQPKTGPLMLFYKVGPSPSEWWGMVMTSDDGGHTWSKAERLPEGILGPIKNKPVQLADGTIISPTSTEYEGWRVHFETSTDGGKTWQASPAVNDGKKIGAIQPSILQYGNNRLQAIGRTRSDGIFQIWSEDSGKTWGEMSLTTLPNPSAGTDAVTLADGRQLLVYNHNPNYKGRSPLNVALSTNGEDWHAALVLEDDKGQNGYSYPAVIQTAEGKVHISYTWRRERIKHVVIDPTKISLQPIVDGTWPGKKPGEY